MFTYIYVYAPTRELGIQVRESLRMYMYIHTYVHTGRIYIFVQVYRNWQYSCVNPLHIYIYIHIHTCRTRLLMCANFQIFMYTHIYTYIQVRDHMQAVAKYTKVKIVGIIGGLAIEKQQRLIAAKPHVVVGTPGRLWEVMQHGDGYLSDLRMLLCLVIDEADRMVCMHVCMCV